MPPKLPPAGPLTGQEVAVVIQGGKPVTTTAQAIADRGPTTKGPKGDKGDTGATGATGSQGPKGDTGQSGFAGPTGPTGASGTAGAKGDTGSVGPKGDTGPQGPDGTAGTTGAQGLKGDTGPAGTPKRIERYTGTTNASGIAPIVFSPAFDAIPDIDIIPGWSGDQEITGGVVAGSATKTGCNVLVKVSRGTLLLTTGPFQTAAAGVPVTVRAIGN